jgi:hypothetical protein
LHRLEDEEAAPAGREALAQYAHRLAGLPARKNLDPTFRSDFLQAGQPIAPDVKTLRARPACPPA